MRAAQGRTLELQNLAEMIDAEAELLEAGKFVEHAPLLDNATSGYPEDRDFLDLHAPPGWLDTPEHALMRSRRDIAAGNPVARAEDVEHVLVPVRECGPDPRDSKANVAPMSHNARPRTSSRSQEEITQRDSKAHRVF